MRLSRDRVMFVTCLVLAGVALRPTLAVVGPLLKDIQAATGLSDVTAGLLTTLPVALMGVCMFATGIMQRWLGERIGITAGIVLIAACSVVRWFGPGEAGMVATALMGGLGIAMVQALMPRVISTKGGEATAALMGFYTTAIMGGALVSSAVAPWLAKAWGWPVAMGLWAAPALLAAIVWASFVPDGRPAGERRAKADRAGVNLFTQLRAWQLVLLFGLGTGAYTLVLAWLPPFYVSLGRSAEMAGAMLAAVTVVEVLSGLAVSFWISRIRDRRPALLTFTALAAAGLACLAVAPVALAWLAVPLVGLGIGGLFPLSLITAMDHARSHDEAGRIMGFVQGGGYILAGLMPVVAGALRQHLSDLTYAWWLMVGLCGLLALIAAQMRPGQDVTGADRLAG